MIKKISKIAIKVIVIVGLLVAIAFLIKDSSDKLKGGTYDASAPTEKKFLKMEKWLPKDVELIVVADLHRYLDQPGAKARLSMRIDEMSRSWSGDGGVLSNLMAQAEKIGLAAFAIGLDPERKEANALLVIQGNFQESAFVDSVKKQLAKEGQELIKEEDHSVTIYAESASEEGFAFAFPDRLHVMLGPKSEIIKLIEQESAGQLESPEKDRWASVGDTVVLFGRFKITPRISRMLPEQLQGLQEASFSADALLTLNVNIPCVGPKQAEDVVMFIEGSRISFLLAQRKDNVIVNMLRQVRVGHLDSVVDMRVPVGEIF